MSPAVNLDHGPQRIIRIEPPSRNFGIALLATHDCSFGLTTFEHYLKPMLLRDARGCGPKARGTSEKRDPSGAIWSGGILPGADDLKTCPPEQILG